ncbi:MAG TPA: tetratricopeptide repeat protein [Oscillatoriaceae cyanobacterium M33_DOE_052]|uniref:Tetratricopeptide repeat protein n=1 Tax=Planktothricoides sp. SpSt-374 TaxID=2282167 RepID=A0A7C3ZGW9_9CYAN|nr:tetratricopeptide repeat protein [Oscillatoriaceae cyanobacterium M33_DOE_052]
MNKQPSGLELLEYVSVAGTVAGSIASIATKQLAYAVTPASLALVLGALNRKRAMDLVLAQVDRGVATVSEQVKSLPNQSQFGKVETNLQKLSASLAQLETQLPPASAPSTADLEPVKEDISQLRTGYSNMQEFLASLRTRLESLPQPERLQQMENALSQLEGKLTQLPDQLQQQQESVAQHTEAIAQMEQRLNSLPVGGEMTAGVSLPAQSPAELEQLKLAIEQLGLKQNELATREELASLATAVELVQQEQIHKLIADVESLDVRVSRMARGQDGVSREELAEVRAELTTLDDRLQTIAGGTESVDLTGVDQALADIAASVKEALGEMESRIVPLEASFLENSRRLDTLREEMAASSPPTTTGDGWQAELERLDAALRTLATKAEVEQLFATVAVGAAVTATAQPASSPSSSSEDLAQIQQDLAQLRQEVETAQANFQKTSLENVDYVREEVHSLQQAIASITEQLEASASNTESAVAPDEELSPNGDVLETPATWQLSRIEGMLQGIQRQSYQLLFDRPGIKALLEDAIASAQERIILVSPWLSRAVVKDLLPQFEALLARNVKLDIGWGHLRDIEAGEFPQRVSQQWQAPESSSRSSLYDALNDMEALELKYPLYFQMRILGTNENFLVCDKSFAAVVSHNFLCNEANFPERELGLRTVDPNIIQGLIDRFEDPVLNPGTAEVYYNRGFERLDVGDYSGALMDYGHSLQLNPNQATAYNNRALAKYHLADPLGAIEDYTAALSLNPNEWVTYFNRGVARFHLQDYAGSIEDYTEAIRLGVDRSVAYFQRAEAYRQLKDYESAIADYTLAINLAPNDAVAYNNRGLARYNSGDYIGSIDDYTQALLLKPDDAIYYSNCGVARLRAGDYAGAVQDFDQAVMLLPEYAGAYNNRGLARSQLGDTTGAIADLRQAAELFLRQGDILNYQQAVESLDKLSDVANHS